VWGGWSMPDLMAYFGSLATPQNKLYALMGDGSEEATLWARPKPGAVPVKLSWSPGVSKTPSYYVVVQR